MEKYKSFFTEALPMKKGDFLSRVELGEIELANYTVTINFPKSTKVNFMSNSMGFGFFGDQDSGISLTIEDSSGKVIDEIKDFDQIEELSSDFGRFADVVIKQGDQEIKVNLPSRGMYYSKEVPKGLTSKKKSLTNQKSLK
jgi:hypothetical protein